VERQVTHIIGVITDVAMGDFSVSAEMEREDDLGALVTGVNMMIEEIRRLNTGLEQEVEERTRELEESRAALMETLEELNRSKRELERAYEELKELDRVKGDIISNISHELRTPITIVRGVLDLLSEEGDRAAVEELIRRGRVALARQDKIVGDLLEIARIERGLRWPKRSWRPTAARYGRRASRGKGAPSTSPFPSPRRRTREEKRHHPTSKKDE
jgi:signal transduction histidine kinase